MDEGLRAYGHAWTEIYIDGNWKIMDATLPSETQISARPRYLPISILEDEGPGYSLSLFGVLASMPSKITGVSNLD